MGRLQRFIQEREKLVRALAIFTALLNLCPKHRVIPYLE